MSRPSLLASLVEGVQSLNKQWHSGSQVLVVVNDVHGEAVLCSACEKTFVSAEHARQHCLSFEHSETTLKLQDRTTLGALEKGKRARACSASSSSTQVKHVQTMIRWLDSLVARISSDAAPAPVTDRVAAVEEPRSEQEKAVKIEVDEGTPERKVPRKEESTGLATGKSIPRNPFQCELLSRSSAKGFYESRYADIPLSNFGCEALYPNGALPRRPAWIGRPCCYLRLGTALVVTGVIVEALDNCAQVSPDRGQNVAVEWVPAGRLYAIPPDLPAVRRAMAESVVSCLTDPLAALKMRLDE